jgi:uncharacterized protein YdeI (YjbR/CyaY-like superfamily)
MTTDINVFFSKGCGRCNKFDTPNCKLNNWKEELLLLRKLILRSSLIETMKWGMPCYQFEGKNVLMIAPFKDNCVISFFKGSLLRKHANILSKAGENSEQSRIIRFNELSEIIQIEKEIVEIINEAIEIEIKGIKIKPKKIYESDFPDEFLAELNASQQLKTAFNNLTPGKKRAYLIYFNSAKQSTTRVARIKKQLAHILSGKGLNE